MIATQGPKSSRIRETRGGLTVVIADRSSRHPAPPSHSHACRKTPSIVRSPRTPPVRADEVARPLLEQKMACVSAESQVDRKDPVVPAGDRPGGAKTRRRTHRLSVGFLDHKGLLLCVSNNSCSSGPMHVVSAMHQNRPEEDSL